jgi:hypothetical protein
VSTDRDFRGEGKGSKAMLATLGTLRYEEIVDELGPPDRVRTMLREGGRGWHQGSPRPYLASEDVAVTQAMARCLSWRALNGSSTLDLGAVLNPGAIHPRVCNWCDYPIAELEAAVSWAGWYSMLVEIEYATWDGSYGSHYDRQTPRQGTYENPRWAAWFSNDPDRETAGRARARAVERAMYGAAEVPA